MSDDLAYMPATQALRLFEERKLSPVEHVSAVIARAEATEGAVNAITHRRFDQAMAAARKAEAKYARDARTGALEGLAVAIKDESTIKGQPTSGGSLLMKDFVADSTSPFNEQILRAGAIVHARTATPEFSCATITHTRLWGVTRNPWNTAFSPGGSSGGSAASLAAGSCGLATGSDIGGSIRIPASTCGLYGLKPSYGRNPADPPFNLDPYAVDGPLGRTAADMITLQNVMCGPHPRDIATLRPRLRISTEVRDLKGWKIAYSPNLGFYPIDPEVRRNTEAALDVFRAAGAVVEEIEMPWTADMLDTGLEHLEHLFGAFINDFAAGKMDQLTDYARSLAEKSQGSTASSYLNSMMEEAKWYEPLGKLFQRYRLLVCPTTGVASVPADLDTVNGTVMIDGQSVSPLLGWVLTLPFNMMGRCPVVSAPSGFASSGVPTGIQIVGRTYRDQDVCQAALAYEAARGQGFTSAAARPKLG